MPQTAPDPLSVLIVDDEQHICALLQDALTRTKLKTVLSASVPEALSVIEQNNFDIIITDLKLPPRSGIDVLAAAKKKDPYCEVIIITGYPTIGAAAESINRGASSFLLKPISIPDFLMQVERAMAQRRFHLHMLSLMQSTSLGSVLPVNVLSIFDFAKSLSRSLQVEAVVKTVVDRVKTDLKASAVYVFVNEENKSDLFVSGLSSRLSEKERHSIVFNACTMWNRLEPQKTVAPDDVYFIFLEPEPVEAEPPRIVHSFFVPLMAMGHNIGFLYVVPEEECENEQAATTLLHVLSNISGPVLDNAYLHRKTERLARTDGLTGTLNHRSFHEHLERELSRALRHKRPLTLALLDIDDFKKVNDTYGHQVGDHILRELVKRIEKSIRTNDILARYGGEEFAVIFPEADLTGIHGTMEKTRKRISDHPFFVEYHEIHLTVSIGVSFCDGQFAITRDELIRKADEAMYKAKYLGKNGICTVDLCL